jgi:hypothetical protein
MFLLLDSSGNQVPYEVTSAMFLSVLTSGSNPLYFVDTKRFCPVIDKRIAVTYLPKLPIFEY